MQSVLSSDGLEGQATKAIQTRLEIKLYFDVISLCPRFLTFPKMNMISNDHIWLYVQISLFTYFNLAGSDQLFPVVN